MKKFLSNFKKPKFWIILVCILIFTLVFGSFACLIGSYITEFFATIWSWLAAALRWLAEVLNFFGWNGMLK